MTPPIAGQTWRRGQETRIITEVTEGFVSAVVYGSRQRDRVICLKWQWERWASKAQLQGENRPTGRVDGNQLSLPHALFDNGNGN